jgi:hypothetical protein
MKLASALATVTKASQNAEIISAATNRWVSVGSGLSRAVAGRIRDVMCMLGNLLFRPRMLICGGFAAFGSSVEKNFRQFLDLPRTYIVDQVGVVKVSVTDSV